MKEIREPKNLALNGAPPAFEQPLHVGRPNLGDREAFLQLAEEIFDRLWLTNNGPLVRELEQRIAEHHGVRNCVAMCNGTVALEIAIRALGLKGEVILPSFTFVATAHALSWQGITPVFADIDPNTHQLDPQAVRKLVTPRTSGIIGVHLWGCRAPVEALQQIADDYGLKLLFDAAHAFGCSYDGKMVGSSGACEVFSFHATKCFNTFEGGAVLTNDDSLAERMRLMRNFGFAGYDRVIHPGTNGKMSEVSAAMGLVNLDAFPNFVEANRAAYTRYRNRLGGISGIRLFPSDGCGRTNYQYLVLEVGTEYPIHRDRLVEALQAENVLARRYFWPGCHKMSPYQDRYPDAATHLPHTDSVAARVVVLPTGSAVTPQAIDLIADVIRVLSDD